MLTMLKAPESSLFYAQGLRFSCIRCSACCRFDSGFVFLSEKDVSLLGTTLNMGYKEFIETYCRWVLSENRVFQLSLKEKSNYDCIFWVQDKNCSVYNARPQQCRAFPFWASIVSDESSWEMTAKCCPGMDKGSLNSVDSIEKWLAIRENEPIISRSTKSKGES